MDKRRPDGGPYITLADVEASFNNKIRNMGIVRWFGRPIGNRLTPFFFNRGWTANQLTTLRLGLAALAMVLLITLPPAFLWLVTILYYLCFVGDLLDGNLARLHDGATYWGKFYDGVADRFYYTAAPLAAAIAVWRDTGLAWPLVGGGLAAVIFTYNDLINNRLKYFVEWMEGQTSPATYRTGKVLGKLNSVNDSIMTNGFFVAPLLLLVPGVGLFGYFYATLLFQGVFAGLGLMALLYRSYRTLSRWRKSMHAVDFDPANPIKPTAPTNQSPKS